MSNKKELAIFLGTTGNMAFAAANVIQSIKKHSGYLNPDIILYNENLSEKDKEVMNSILHCRFYEYKFPNVDKNTFKNTHFYRYSMLAYSRYEIFNFLKEYKNIIWLDIDTLVQQDLKLLIDSCDGDMGMYEENLAFGGLFVDKKVSDFDNERKFNNTGVILYKDTIPNYEILTQWCYDKTFEYAEQLSLPDQAIINMMFQVFPEIKIKPIDRKFNCHPTDKNVKNAVIVHSYDSEKFWNFYYNFKEWNDNYKQWLKMGGSPYTGIKANIIYVWIKKFLPMAPNPFRQTGKFFKYIFKIFIRIEKIEKPY